MSISNRSLRWLQIIITLFYGQVISTSIFEYIIQGIYGLTSMLRPTQDSIILICIGVLMLTFVFYSIFALWYSYTKMFLMSVLILIAIFFLTLLKSIIEIRGMGQVPIRSEWMAIRIVELLLRVFGIAISIIFLVCLRRGWKPQRF